MELIWIASSQSGAWSRYRYPQKRHAQRREIVSEIYLDAIRKLRRTMVDLDPINAMER